MPVGEILKVISQHTEIKLSNQQITNLWETCKTGTAEETPILERIINVKDLVT